MANLRKALNILHEEEDDPILSVVNIIDVFLVIIAILLITIIENPLNPFGSENVVVVKNPGEADMEMIIKQGETLTRYESSGQIGEGEGSVAGTTYRLRDGSLIYVPSD